MKIKKIYIKKFRNLKNVIVEPQGKNWQVLGVNRLGKTNCLNAIYWCFTGVDLENNSNDGLNIPYGDNEAYVSIECDIGKISRGVNSEHKQTIKINEVEVKKSEAENFFGIKGTKEFNLIRFFLNPIKYLEIAKESDFRKWYVSTLGVSIENLFKGESDFNKKILKELEKRKFNIEETSKYYATLKKQAKAGVEKWEIIGDYLKEFRGEDLKAIEQADTMQHIFKNDLASAEEQILCLDLFCLKLSKEYQKKTTVCLLEKGVEEDVWKEKCKPLVANSNTYYDNGSTAEKIITLVNFVASVNSPLPILIDQFECIDNIQARKLGKGDNQLIVAKVENGYTSLESKEL